MIYIDSLVQSLKKGVFSSSHLIISVCYETIFLENATFYETMILIPTKTVNITF